MKINELKVALVHDWFQKNSIGGAEKVTFLLDKFLINNYSRPDIFSLVSNLDESHNILFKNRLIKTSIVQKLPFGRTHVQNYLPILPFAIEQLDLTQYDLIISSSHSFAKGIMTNPDQLHISYIHTPVRYAWDLMNTYINQTNFTKFGFEIPIRYILFKLRQWDFLSSQRINYLISNSNFTANRIKKYWGLNSEVINPPVNVERFKHNQARGNFYLSVNRLVPNKRIDLLIKAFNKLELPLIIIGDGPESYKLQRIAKANIKFINRLTNNEVERYMSECRAFVYAGIEDFGIAPVEAMAAGAPVIAYGKGGILDTVNCITESESDKLATGLLFPKQSTSYIIDAINWFEDKEIWKKFSPDLLNNYSKKFSSEIFTSKIDFLINKVWEKFNK